MNTYSFSSTLLLSLGVDPVARREIWQLISDMVSDTSVELKDRTSVILTTHSMEECEALW